MDDVIKKNKGGRPKLEKPKTEPIGFRCDPEEYAQIVELAAGHGLTAGEYARMRSLGGRMPKLSVPPINIEKYQELAKLSSNLNQLMKAINSEKVTNIDIDVVENLYSEVAKLRENLMGITDDSEY